MDKTFCDVCGDEISYNGGVTKGTKNGIKGSHCDIGFIPGVKGFPNNLSLRIEITGGGLDIKDICIGCLAKWLHLESEVQKKERRLGAGREEWMKFKKRSD